MHYVISCFSRVSMHAVETEAMKMRRPLVQAYVNPDIRDRIYNLRTARRPIPSESEVVGEAILRGLPLLEAGEEESGKAGRK